MGDRVSPISRSLQIGVTVVAPIVCCLLPAAIAHADGTIDFVVRDSVTQAPVEGATITLEDPTGAEFRQSYLTNASGLAQTGPLAPHTWRVIITGVNYTKSTQQVDVVDSKPNDITILLQPLSAERILVTGIRELIRRDDTTNSTRRSRDFFRLFPLTAGDRQAYNKALRSVPGFVDDSINQIHPRGEQGSIGTYIDGYLLPPFVQGNLGQIFTPDSIEQNQIVTGGFSPEFGGQTGATANLTSRSILQDPIVEFSLSDASFDTNESYVTFGRSFPLKDKRTSNPENTANPRRFGFVLTGSQHYSRNALEAPQTSPQAANNFGRSEILFGKFELRASQRDQITGMVNYAYGLTGSANRAGLGSGYFSPQIGVLGQGFGYGGLRNGGSLQSFTNGIQMDLLNQLDAQQDIYQKDINNVALLQYKRTISPTSNILFSVGYTQSILKTLNNTNLFYNLHNLPDDSSVEFLPTVANSYDQLQAQADYQLRRGKHTLKAGGVFTDMRGRESYQLIAGSQRALNAIYTFDPRLVPATGAPDGTHDALGNSTYNLDPSVLNPQTPVYRLSRTGAYGAVYLQDTFRVNAPLTINYGFRYDNYNQKSSQNQATVNESELSPRLNIAYVLPNRGIFGFLGKKLTILRASYDRLFNRPPLEQGLIEGNTVRPETADQYDMSIERQFDQHQTAKLAVYSKTIDNYFDIRQLLPGTQIGTYSIYNIGKATSHGYELSYDYTPRGAGLAAYLVYANGTVQPELRNGLTSTGLFFRYPYVDNDQRHTVSSGLSYRWQDGATAGLNLYYGSGTASSSSFALSPFAPQLGRESRTEVNLRLTTRPTLIRNLFGVELEVQNLFDDRSRINYRSAFEGTRFAQGRRIVVSVQGKF